MYNGKPPEQFVSDLAEENRAFFSDTKGRGALRFLDQAFPHNWIYLAELLQNAIDEGAHAVSVRVVGTTLVFEHDGNPFSDANVKGLCSAGLSTKSVGTVGFMGVGFKSVFHSFESVSIASGPWRFRLRAAWHTSDSHYQERIRDWLGTVIPTWDETISPPTDGMTCRFTFSDRVEGLPAIERDLMKVLQKNLSLLPLLSRKGIQRLHWNGTTWHLTASQGDALVDEVIPLKITARCTNAAAESQALSWLLLSKRYRPSGEAIRTFLEHRQKEPPTDPEERKAFYRQAERYREVEAFVELDEDGIPKNPSAGQAFAVLPMDMDLPIGLHIQADWLLVVTRAEPKQPDNAWHNEIKQQIPSLIAGYLDWLVNSTRPSGWYRGYQVMPDFRSETRIGKWLLDNDFCEKLRTLLLDFPFLPTLAPDTFATPRESRFLTDSFNSLLEPRFKPEVLIGRRIVNSPLFRERAMHTLQRLELVQFLQPSDIEPFWLRGGIAKWYERLDPGLRDIGLSRLLASLRRLEKQPGDGAVWAEFECPCVPTESGGWAPRKRLHRLPGDWQVLNQIQGMQSALKALVVDDSELLSWQLRTVVNHPSLGEEDHCLRAREYLQLIPEERLESLVERWWASLSEAVDTDTLDLVIRFTRWVKEKQPNRSALIHKLVADDLSGTTLLLPADKTLLSAPYAEAFRDIFYPDTPRVSRDYLYGGKTSPIEFRSWHDFFRGMKPSPGGLFSLKANTEEWSATPQNQKTLASRLKCQLRDLRHKATYIPPKTDPFGNTVKHDHYYLTDFQLDSRWPNDTTLEHWIALAAAKWLHEFGHAVFFPDVTDLNRLVTPNSPVEILGGRVQLTELASWIEQVFDCWGGRDEHWSPLGPVGIRVVKETLCQPILVMPLIAHQLEEEEKIRIRLTEQQGRLLRALGVRRRAAICGGAGTGKTLLAIQRARELADSGFRTLFLCYNTLLANHLREVVQQHDPLFCMSFHQLCSWRANTVSNETGLNLLEEAANQYPHEDVYDVQLPYALARSTELSDERFDAIIIDEAQDFKEDFWLPVEMLLADPDQSTLYIFYDQNQALYTRASTFPIQDQPFVLTVNCRNTQVIHQAAYQFYQGDPTDPPEIEGTPIDIIAAPDVAGQARRLSEHITRLIDQEGLSADQIAVLVCGVPKAHYYDELCRWPLPGNTRWRVESGHNPNAVTVETYRRFKGLEADIVFLWGVDHLDPANDREALYVSISRAKSRLYLIGTREGCDISVSHLAAGHEFD